MSESDAGSRSPRTSPDPPAERSSPRSDVHDGLRGEPLRAGAPFFRAHGLGNDYLVFRAVPSEHDGWPVNPQTIQRVCDRQQGVGGDGIVILLDPAPADGVFPLRMFNPDGSEFERSGNGLRILAAFLHREGLVGTGTFRVRSGGDVIPMVVHGLGAAGRYDISVEMGQGEVGIAAVEADQAHLDADGRIRHPGLGALAFVPVSVGNPHAVFFPAEPGDDLLRDVGPFVATHDAFPAGTNVQLARVDGPAQVRIWIWERGVGRTSASGTSSCAVAAAAVATGRVEAGVVRVVMDGGELMVTVSPDLGIVLRGPVDEVAEGRMTPGFLRSLEEGPGTSAGE